MIAGALICCLLPSFGRQGLFARSFSDHRSAPTDGSLIRFAELLLAFNHAARWQATGHGKSQRLAVKDFIGKRSRSRSENSLAMSLPPLPERVFLVTGSTDGIGKFTAEQLAREGCTVLIHGRNPTKIAATIEELQKLAPRAKFEGFQADLSLMAEVRRLAADVSSKYPVLHGLLNNAGTFDGDYTGSRVVTDEGNEYSLAVNVMAPFLLTSLLIDNVRSSGAGRIIATSSISKGSGQYLNNLQLEGVWDKHRAYSLSKLCDAMMIAEMHARYGNAPQLCFHTMDPGTVDTKMLRAGWWTGGASVRTATRSFKMLTAEEYQERSGSNLGDPFVADRQKRVQLWNDLVTLTGASWPEADGIAD